MFVTSEDRLKLAKTQKHRRQTRALRASRVAAGLCAFCGDPRLTYGYLCDGCEEKHRERQRWKALDIVVRQIGKCFSVFVDGKYHRTFAAKNEADTEAAALTVGKKR